MKRHQPFAKILALLPLAALKPRSLRFLLSDFLFAADPAPELRRLAAGAAHVVVVQLLDPWELDPRADGPLTVVDCESSERRASRPSGAAKLTARAPRSPGP